MCRAMPSSTWRPSPWIGREDTGRESDEVTIWVDADGLPAKMRHIVEKASRRTGTGSVFVSDRGLPIEERGPVSLAPVETGEDSADEYICGHCREGDLAVTRDVFLSERLVERGVLVLDDRGGVYTEENIRERVSVRERMKEFRDLGLQPEESGGRKGRLNERDVRAFAEALDRELSRLLRRGS